MKIGVFIIKDIMKFTITEEEKKSIRGMYLLEDEYTEGIIIKPKPGDNVNVLVKLVTNDYDSINNLKSVCVSFANKVRRAPVGAAVYVYKAPRTEDQLPPI